MALLFRKFTAQTNQMMKLPEIRGAIIVRRMNDQEQAILETLRDLEVKVEAMKTAAPKPNLLPVFERLDQLTRGLGPNGDPSLLHYLHKKSYEKARLYLEGRDAENARGSCRH